MKLIFAVVHNDDKKKIQKQLSTNGFRSTAIASTGGFLREGNSTLMIGVENKDRDSVIDIIKNNSRKRKIMIENGMSSFSMFSDTISIPNEVELGKSAIFVVNAK